jgi:hypothetical protein
MVLFCPNKKYDKVGTGLCREGLHALPKTMFDLFLKTVGAFVSGWWHFHLTSSHLWLDEVSSLIIS